MAAPSLAEDLTEEVSWSLQDDDLIEDASLLDVAAKDGELDHVEVVASRLCGVQLTGLMFNDLRMVDVVVDASDLSGVVLHDSSWLRVEVDRCRSSGLVATGLRGNHVRFVDCRLDGVNLRFAELASVVFVACDLRGADFGSAKLQHVRFQGCDLRGATFHNTKLEDVGLHGSNVEGLQGGDALRGVAISSDQVLPLAHALFGALGIIVDDEHS